jgi:hypothetical protein
MWKISQSNLQLTDVVASAVKRSEPTVGESFARMNANEI